MFKYITSNFIKGIKHIRDNFQIVFTLFTAIIIFFAFIFVSNNFLRIARDAQDRLINVRVGSMHDAFVEFMPKYINKPEELSEKIYNIGKKNETIHEFRVVKFLDNKKLIVSSLNKEEIGLFDEDNDIIYGFAAINPTVSLTMEETLDGERFFKTARAITDEDGTIIGAIFTRQSLSMADKIIADGIINSIIVLIVVLFIIMILFFRHARIVDYVKLYNKLKEANQTKDDFISIATHELRTPLTIIRGYADLLKSSKNIDKENKEIVDIIDIHAKRLSGLIDDILFVPRIEQGRLEFHLEKFDPSDEIKKTVDSLKKVATDKNLELSYEIKDSSLILADKNGLKQVLTNVIGNAIKYTEKGSIKIEVSVKEKNLFIRVRDTGIGMSAEAQKKLFQKFYRIRSKETEHITGTGLGLWITLKILQIMNGSISVESIKGVGTHAIIVFPIVEANNS